MTRTDRAVTDHLGPPVSGTALTALAELVGMARPLEVVDVGASPLVGEPARYDDLVEQGLARVAGFEPDPDALAALHREAHDGARYLGEAVGDGREHELRVCAAPGFTSLFEPDPAQLAVLTDFPRLAEVVDRRRVSTVRLDDVDGISRADLIVLDVQGAEPQILDGGARLLASAVAVQVEVAFHRLYEGGPTLTDVDTRLRAAGFVPHAFVTSRTWPVATVEWDDPLESHARHLVEADLLYVRDLARLDVLPDDALRALVLVACGAYGSIGPALLAVRDLEARGQVRAGAATEFRDLVTNALGVPGVAGRGD